MSSLKDLTKLPNPTPQGWEAGVKLDGEEGYITTPPRPADEKMTDEEWEHVFDYFGIDPEKYMIEGKVRHSAWDVAGHGVHHAYRAHIVERPERSFDIEELVESIHDRSDRSEEDYGFESPDYEVWRTIQIGDTHIGKGEADGGGTDKIIEQWKISVKDALLQSETEIDGVHIAFLGDLIEGQVSQGGKTAHGNDLSLTEQLRVARHMVMWTIETALDYTSNVIVSSVPGNHGETTRQFSVEICDSYDIDIVSSVQQAYELAKRDNDKVTFLYPKSNEGHLTYDVGDTTFTVVHGHNFRGKMNGAEKWWSGMSVNGREPGRATILLAGHFHSAQISNFTKDKWILFSPSLETQSTWFAEKQGSSAKSGVLTYLTCEGEPFAITVC